MHQSARNAARHVLDLLSTIKGIFYITYSIFYKMNKTLIVFFTSLLFFVTIELTKAQYFLPEQVISKYDSGKLKVRWEPSTIEEWEASIKMGYEVEIAEIAANGMPTLPTKQLVKPLAFADWQKKIGGSNDFLAQFYQGCSNFIYPESIVDQDQKLSNALLDQSNSSLDSFRLGLMLYSATYDFDIAKSTGLALEINARQGSKYRLKISVSGFKAINADVMAVVNVPDVASLQAVWGDKEVELKWNTYNTRKHYFGYISEKSIDGVVYNRKDAIPNVNTLDKYGDKDEALKFYSRKDTLEVNYKNYYFRIKGFDYFGDISEKHSSVVGHGFDKLTLSPMLVFADQTEQNEAYLKWQIADKQIHLIKDFSVLRADTIDGKYEVVLDSINPSLREVKFKMKYTTNYFRLEANPKDGKSLSSMPVLVMGQDTIPPLKPIIISAILDSLGRAQITWHANAESDLWGYRLYKSNFHSDEFSLITSYPILDTMYFDSLDLDLGTKDIFYLIEAADKRNNTSPRSDTIRIQLPDVIPPFSPVIASVKQIIDTVLIDFTKSGSDDVAMHTIYRKNIKTDKSWKKLIDLKEDYAFEYYKDTTIIYGQHYAYTIIAKDKTGLESVPEHFKEIVVIEPEKEFIPFVKIEKFVDLKKKTISIKWETNKDKKLKSVLVYRGSKPGELGKYKYVDAPFTELVDDIKDTQGLVYYRLKPVFENQEKIYFSDVIEVRMNKKEETRKGE